MSTSIAWSATLAVNGRVVVITLSNDAVALLAKRATTNRTGIARDGGLTAKCASIKPPRHEAVRASGAVRSGKVTCGFDPHGHYPNHAPVWPPEKLK